MSIRTRIYRFLDRPWAYKAIQAIAAPGAASQLDGLVRKATDDRWIKGRTLDIGCGPRSWLEGIGTDRFGLDLSLSYIRALTNTGTTGIVGSADQLPFISNSFDCAMCMGLMHHLPNTVARDTISEMKRATRPGGPIVIIDAVFPQSPLRFPAYILRRLDRGEFVRTERQHLALFDNHQVVSKTRLTYSVTGLEAVVVHLEGEE